MWVIGVLGLFVDMLSIGVFTTRQWRTPGPMGQELHIFTVKASKDVLIGMD